jgi:hypothetical protein
LTGLRRRTTSHLRYHAACAACAVPMPLDTGSLLPGGPTVSTRGVGISTRSAQLVGGRHRTRQIPRQCRLALAGKGWCLFMAASPLATVVSGYVNEICMEREDQSNGCVEATRIGEAPAGPTCRTLQRLPEAQGSRTSQPCVRQARVCDVRRSRSPARGFVQGLRGAQGAPGARTVLRVLQARMAVHTPARPGKPRGTPSPPRRAALLISTPQRQRQKRTASSGPSDTSTSASMISGPPAVDASVAPSGDHATAVTTSSWPVNVSMWSPDSASKR